MSFGSPITLRRFVTAPTRREARTELWLIPLVVASALAAGGATAISSSLTPLVPVAVLIAVLAGATVLRRPALGLPIALVLLWTDSTGVASFYHGLPTESAVLVPGLLLLPLLSAQLSGQKMRLDEGFVWMSIYVAVEAVAAIGSAYPSTGLGRVEKTVQEGLVVYLLLINVVRTPQALRVSTWSLITGAAMMSLVTAAQALSHRYTHTFFGFAQEDHSFLQGKDSSFRVQGPVADPNYYAQILVTTLPLAIVAMLRESSRRARIGASIAAGLMLLSIVFTYSRGAAVALVVVILLLACFRYVRARHLIAIVALIAVLVAAFPSYRNRLASITGISGATASVGSSTAADLSVQQRATENLAAWLAIKDHPVLGLGPGVFPILYQDYAAKVGGAVHNAAQHPQDRAGAGEAPQRAVPNLFLSVAADSGVIGFVAIICLLGFSAGGLLRARRRWRAREPQLEMWATGYFVALVGYVVSGMFLALAFERYLWALIALCGATILLSRPRTAMGHFYPDPSAETSPEHGRTQPCAADSVRDPS